jgi:hypothetical protein
VGALGPHICFIFFLSVAIGSVHCESAYCEGFAGFSGMASDAWAWVMVGMGLLCALSGMGVGCRVVWGSTARMWSNTISQQIYMPNIHLLSFVVLFHSGVEMFCGLCNAMQSCFFLVGTVAQE